MTMVIKKVQGRPGALTASARPGGARVAGGAPGRGGRRRGRPPGPTAQGEETRARLQDAALELMASEGYGGTTLRAIAARAGVSHALLYRYFPSKGAVVLALYERLSADFARRTTPPKGRWRTRALHALRGSLETLAPHRETLRGAQSVLVSAGEGGIFAPGTRFSLERVRGVFVDAVSGATDAPKGARAATLGRLLYLVHLGVILVWLLDRSSGQRATAGLLAVVGTALTLAAAALKLPGAWSLAGKVDALLEEALLEPTSAEAS